MMSATGMRKIQTNLEIRNNFHFMIRSDQRSAFTLVELLFVIVLIALITSVAIPRISSTLGLNVRSNVLKVTGFLEIGYQQAILSHQKIRMNFDMDQGTYWAENYVEAQGIPMINETTNLDEILNTFRKRSEEPEDSEENKKAADALHFQKIESQVLKPSQIDSSLKFKSIIFPGKHQTNTQGIVSFFISASGLNDEVVIYVSHGEDVTYSIIMPPMTGKPRIEQGEADVKDL